MSLHMQVSFLQTANCLGDNIELVGWTTHLKNMRARRIGSSPQKRGWKEKLFETTT